MKDKNLEKQVDNAVDSMQHIVDILTDKITELEQDIEDLEKQHEKELIISYDKGYNDAVFNHTKLLVK